MVVSGGFAVVVVIVIVFVVPVVVLFLSVPSKSRNMIGRPQWVFWFIGSESKQVVIQRRPGRQ